MARFEFGVGIVLLALGCGSGGASSIIAFDLPETKGPTTLVLGCKSFQPNGPIPQDFTSYGLNEIPELAWASAARGVKSFVLMVEDPDAPGAEPFVHWLVLNIDPGASGLPGSGEAGLNSNGQKNYFGPKPPDSSPHHYHFELFALDETLPASVRDRDGAVAAMKDHVLAKGEFVSMFQKP